MGYWIIGLLDYGLLYYGLLDYGLWIIGLWIIWIMDYWIALYIGASEKLFHFLLICLGSSQRKSSCA
jgi:hypothetical protein